jgi:DNA-binding GntR family transcriptional regulator
MVAHHDKGNRPTYFELNQAIHQRIADLSGNQARTSWRAPANLG